MQKKDLFGLLTAGAAAGAVCGLLGAGGGMILIPLMSHLTSLDEEKIFPASVAVMLPVCLVSLGITAFTGTVAWSDALPWLPGSALGGLLAGTVGKKIPVNWLHRVLGLFILWGGIRYLW